MVADPVVAGGTPVDQVLLEVRRTRGCGFGECDAMCCINGVYVFTEEVDDLLEHQELIKPHLSPGRRDVSTWFDGIVITETDHPAGGTAQGTVVMPDETHPAGQSCVFLRPDRACGLQVAGRAAGEDDWRFKPLWCAMHPLVFDEGVLTVADDNPVSLAGGHCSRPDPESDVPLYRVYEAEARLALGDAGFEALDVIARHGGVGRRGLGPRPPD